ncbi:MAG TPA: response regulator [Desulfuromonadales bacterium]|nr:response regulator [Desulfuromonadales bacterium]
MPFYNRWANLNTSFQFKLFTIFTLLTFLLSFLLSTLYIISEKRESRHNAADQLQMRARILADAIRLPLYAENQDLLQQVARQVSTEAHIHSVVISTADGRILAGVQSSLYQQHPDGNSHDVISQSVEVRSGQSDFQIESAFGGVSTPPAILGSVSLVRDISDFSQKYHRTVLISLCSALVFWLGVTLLCYLVLRRLTVSFNSLVHGIEIMKSGDFIARIVVESEDEPGRAALAVNDLAEALRKRSEENARLLELQLGLERQILHSQKLESLGVMAGGIAHDFNNLLQTILGYMELAAMNLPPDSAPHKDISYAMESAHRAAHLTGLMLTYAGKNIISKKMLNLNKLVEENASLLKSAATSLVTVDLSLAADQPTIMADHAQIQQVIMNLVTNAAESIEKPPGLVRLTTGSMECDKSFLEKSLLTEKPPAGLFAYLEVKDNGCGMGEETIARIFDPFFTTKFTGRGLGMSAVIGIMRSHSGALIVESQPGMGTTFTVLFPWVEASLPVEIPATEKYSPTVAAAKSPLSGLVLVVDDEKSVLRVCTKMVTLCGFTVISAVDGVDAVSKFHERADEIAVVLMDLTMPNMDGIDAMAEIYRSRPHAKVILASGFSEDELGDRITGQPPAGFIRKPYSIVVLEAELRRVVGSGT